MTLKDYGIEHFVIQELVPKSIFEAYPEDRILHWLDIRWVKAWNWIRRERGNTIYMNTYGISAPEWYPVFQGRGLRVPKTAGHKTSQHYYGRAGDGDEVGVPNKELYQFCLDNQKTLISLGITTIEDIKNTPTWVHLDCRYRGENVSSLSIVSP